MTNQQCITRDAHAYPMMTVSEAIHHARIADAAFTRALEAAYGRRAVQRRYSYDRLEPISHGCGERYQRACQVEHLAWSAWMHAESAAWTRYRDVPVEHLRVFRLHYEDVLDNPRYPHLNDGTYRLRLAWINAEIARQIPTAKAADQWGA